MSASLPKMSDIIYSNNLCYYKVPYDYNALTDTHSYAFSVAASEIDDEFNSHLFDASDYQPNAELSNDPKNLYKKVAIVSGTADYVYSISKYGVEIKAPFGTVKNEVTTYDTETDYFIDSAKYTTIAGFNANTVVFGSYENFHDEFINGGSYHGVVTSNAQEDIINNPYYRTFIAVAISASSDGDIDTSNSFYVIGATLIKLNQSELNSALLREFQGLSISVVDLNYGDYAQMYYAYGSSYKIPDGLPLDYFSHSLKISNAVVLWEKIRAYIPDSLTAAPKKYSSVKIASAGQYDCFIEPSASSTKIGSITVKNTFYPIYDIKSVTNEAGSLEAWLRLGDPKQDNNCWMKFVSKTATPVTAQTQFSFRLNNDVANFDEFDWQYVVVSDANNKNWGDKNRYDLVPTTGNTGWKDFKWTADSEGDGEYETGEDSYIDSLSDMIPVSGEYAAPNGNNANAAATWVTTDNAYKWLYIKAISNSPDGLLGYQITYLDSDIQTVSTYSYYDSNLEKYCYIFRYRVDAAKEIEIAEDVKVSVNTFSDLEISPFIKDNRVSVYGRVVQSYDSTLDPNTVGKFEFYLIDSDGNEYSSPMTEFSRGATISVHVMNQNGWDLNGPSQWNITLPDNDNYEVYVVSAEFTRKTDPITVIIENTDITKGSIITNFDGTSSVTKVVSGNVETQTISCYTNDLLTLNAIPISLDADNNELNIGTLSRWEYEYNTTETDTEWRLMNNTHNYSFNIHLWQSEGSNNMNKYIYKYRAIWGRKCILY